MRKMRGARCVDLFCKQARRPKCENCLCMQARGVRCAGSLYRRTYKEPFFFEMFVISTGYMKDAWGKREKKVRERVEAFTAPFRVYLL